MTHTNINLDDIDYALERELIDDPFESFEGKMSIVPTKVCKLTDLLTLKLERKRTNIYVDGKLFRHCKYLLLNLTREKYSDYDEIDSIDEAFELYSRKNETDKTILDPETEFFGHCSNMQAWIEYDYDVRILHSNLSFPLLGALVKAGDKKAEMVLKEEIAERINTKNENILTYFINQQYMYLFTYEELETIFNGIDITNQKLLKQINNIMNIKYILDQMREKTKEVKRKRNNVV